MFGSKTSKVEKAIAKKNTGVLTAMLNDKDHNLRMAAIAALGKIKDDDSYNALITLLRNPASEVRVAAADALAESGDAKARAHIDHMMATESDETVKEALRKAVAKLHTNE